MNPRCDREVSQGSRKMIRSFLLVSIIACTAFFTSCSEVQDDSVDGAEGGDNTLLNHRKEDSLPPEAIVDMNLDEKGRALRGYDPVAYYTENTAIKGHEAFSFFWNDARWWFVSADNRDEFKKNPDRYAPANGGYCTFGIVLEKKFDGDPKVWSIVDDQLYVFLSEEVKTKFFQDKDGNFNKVAVNWEKIKDKSPDELSN